MKTSSKSVSVIVPAVVLALFAAGVLAGRVLSLPLPAALVGLGLALLGLRLGVMAAAIEEPTQAPARLVADGAVAHRHALHAAKC